MKPDPKRDPRGYGRYRVAVIEWAEYCLRFGHDPAALKGNRYPGFEAFVMDDEMAADVRAKMEK